MICFRSEERERVKDSVKFKESKLATEPTCKSTMVGGMIDAGRRTIAYKANPLSNSPRPGVTFNYVCVFRTVVNYILCVVYLGRF